MCRSQGNEADDSECGEDIDRGHCMQVFSQRWRSLCRLFVADACDWFPDENYSALASLRTN